MSIGLPMTEATAPQRSLKVLSNRHVICLYPDAGFRYDAGSGNPATARQAVKSAAYQPSAKNHNDGRPHQTFARGVA